MRDRNLLGVRLSVAASALLVGLNLNLVSIAFADMRSTSFKSASLAQLSWVISIYTIFVGATLVAAGRFADRVGRRRVFLLGLGCFGAASFVISISPWLWLVIAGRAAQGVAASAVIPSALGLMLDALPVERQARATAFFSSLSSVGGVLGPTVGALGVKAANWRLGFFITALVAAFALEVGRRSLPRSLANKSAGLPDLLGASLIVVMLTGFSLAIVQGRVWHYGDSRTIAAFTIGVLCIPLFIYRSATHPTPILPLKIFRIRSVAIADLAALAFGISTGAVLFVNVQVLSVVWGYSVFRSGLGLLPLSIAAASLAIVAGRLGSRFGERAVGAPGMIALGLGVFSYRLFFDVTPSFWGVWVPASLLAGIGFGLTYPMIASASVRGVSAGDLSVASASNRTALQIGNAIGIALVVALLGNPQGPEALPEFQRAWLLLGAMSLVTAVLVLSVGRRPAVAYRPT